MLLTPAQIKWDGCVSCLHACLGTRLLPQSYQYPNLLDSTDHVGGQLKADKECPFSGVTKSGRVWRKMLESNAGSVRAIISRVNIGTISKAVLGTLLRDLVECIIYILYIYESFRAYLTILNQTELFK